MVTQQPSPECCATRSTSAAGSGTAPKLVGTRRPAGKRQFPKPESEWVIQENEDLRIVPQALWEQVVQRREKSNQDLAGVNRGRGLPETERLGGEALPEAALLRGDDLRGLREIHRAGERQGRWLLRLHLGDQEGLRQSSPGAPQFARDGFSSPNLRDRVATAENIEYVLQRVAKRGRRRSTRTFPRPSV